MDMCIWVIIPVHNRREMTKSCLESLSRQEYRNFEIIVIDDGSSDGTETMIKNEFPDVILLRGDGHFFWTKATNLGVKEALRRASGSDYVLTLNNDLKVREDYLAQLMRLALGSPKALIGSIALDLNNNEKIIGGGIRIHWRTAGFERMRRGDNYNELLAAGTFFQEVNALSGRGTLIPVSVFKEIGLYNEEKLPQYAADLEFSIRALNNGRPLLMSYQAPVLTRVEETGLNNAVNFLTWKDYLKSFTSICSANNLYYRRNFAKLCCPGIKGYAFIILDTVRVILGSLRNQIFQKLSGKVRIKDCKRKI